MSSLAATLPGKARQLTLQVGGQSYAMDGQGVREVIRRPKLIRVPHGPPALLGVCNLRGTVLPVVSLARLMGSTPGPEERVVVLDQGGAVGLLVDAVLALDEDAAAQQLDIAALLVAGFPRPVARLAARTAVDTLASARVATTPQRLLVTFLVNSQSFALPLGAVLEVQRLPAEIASVAHADGTVRGLANVRDQSIPIISLAGLLGFADTTMNANDRMLIVEHQGQQIGLVADAIQSILRLDETAIDPVPAILKRGAGDAELDAIGRPGHGLPLVSILSVPKLFAHAEVGQAVGEARQEHRSIAADVAAVSARQQFVIFTLGDEQYGVPIAAVAEVIRLPELITRLPNGPRFIAGVINLRGRPVPLIDQRQRFEAPPAQVELQPRVLIVQVGQLQAGFVVDAVSEILSVDPQDIVETPPLSSERAAVFNRAIDLRRDGNLILLIDAEALLSQAEQDVVADIAARQNVAGLA